jgi:hypothetical protein
MKVDLGAGASAFHPTRRPPDTAGAHCRDSRDRATPSCSVGRIVVVVVVLVMDRELAQLLAFKVASAVRTDPWK